MVKQYEIYIVDLDPTTGSEIKKTRPCVIISPNEINQNLQTVLVAPLTSTIKNYPFRVQFKLNNRDSSIVLDQIRSVDKSRLKAKVSVLDAKSTNQLKAILKEMLVD